MEETNRITNGLDKKPFLLWTISSSSRGTCSNSSNSTTSGVAVVVIVVTNKNNSGNIREEKEGVEYQDMIKII